MNRPIPVLGSVKNPGELSEKFFKNYSHLALPLISKLEKDTSELIIDLPAKTIKSLEKIYELKFSEEIKKNGRILVRKSGTENLIRIMVEGENAEQINIIAKKIANFIKQKDQ